MEENNVEQNLVGTIGYFMYAVRRYLVLMLAIIIVCISAGTVFSLVREPNYTANARVVVSATSLKQGAWSDDTNLTQNYIDTVIDFCNSGVVIDRANYYYLKWDYEKNGNYEASLDEFLKNPPMYNTNPENTDIEYSINPANVKTASVTYDNATGIVFDVSYTDKTEIDAQEKVNILICAFAQEVKLEDSQGEKVYFNFNVDLKNGGIESIDKDMSTISILMISTILGILLAALVLYVLILLDNSIRSKEELEAIVGASMLACIQKNGGNKNGK